MINNIIFSKNRAMQLHALLSSLDKHAEGLFKTKVIYTYTDELFKNGYDICKVRNPNVEFILQNNLKTDVLNNMTDEFTCFMVDDQIMFKAVPDIELKALGIYECFSLRLGANVGHPHISYPLSVDGHIFRTSAIKPLVKAIDFDNPNHLESRLQKYKSMWNVYYRYQCMVSIPHNRVSSGSHCAFSGLYTEDILNNRFLDGFEIDFNRMDFSDITNVHANIDYKFKERD